MLKNKLLPVGMILLAVLLSCKSFSPSGVSNSGKGPSVDFNAPGEGLNVTVELDRNTTSKSKIGKAGGTVSLTSSDGSKFELAIPPNALETETEIVMTAVKKLDGSPLDLNTPTAVQLEPSGLFFNEFATLTVVPAKEIPIANQIIFGYEGNGTDYHLARVDPKSKEIKIKINEFSGAGVGSGSDSAWAAHLQLEAEAARTRLTQRLAQVLQASRRHILLGGDDEADEGVEEALQIVDQYEDQVLLKEMAAAELDCQFARKALQDLISLDRQRQLHGGEGRADFGEKALRLRDIASACKKAYTISGSSNGVTFTGQACGLDKPFNVDATFPGGTAKFTLTPSSPVAGSSKTEAGGSGCSMTGGGSYSLMLNNDGSGSIDLKTTDTVSCQGFSNTRTNNFKLTLKQASDASCK